MVMLSLILPILNSGPEKSGETTSLPTIVVVTALLQNQQIARMHLTMKEEGKEANSWNAYSQESRRYARKIRKQ